MLTSFHTKSLEDYFHRSGRFYYAVIDLQGNFISVNPLLQEQLKQSASNFYGIKAASIFLEADSDTFKQSLQECLQNPIAASKVDLNIVSATGISQIVNWEISATLNEESIVENFQAIGFKVYEPNHTMAGIGHRIGEMAERYKTYEQSAEGLWRFELKKPIHQSPLPQEFIDHCRKYSFLTECNDNMARMHGYENVADFVGTAVATILDYSDESHVNKIRKFIQNGFRSMLIETKEFDRFGNTKYFLNKMEGTVEDGMLTRIWGTQQDITEQRLIEENNKYLANIVETVSDIIFSQDKDFNIVSWNKAAEMVYGYLASEMIGKKINEVLHFELQGISQTRFFEMLNENREWQGEAAVINKHGKHLRVLTAITTIQKSKEEITGYVSVSKDITERKKAEDQLRQQAAILSNVSDLIMTTDFNNYILSWNKKAEDVTGYSAEEAIGNFLGEMIRPDYGDSSSELSLAALNEKGFWQGEISFINKHGFKKYILHTATYLLDETGHRVAIIGTGKDITERKRAEAQLQESEHFYRNMSLYSLDGVVMSDAAGKITYCGPSVEKISGYKPEQLLGHNFIEFVHPTDVAAASDAFIRELNKQSVLNYILLRLKHATKGWTWSTIRAHNLLDTPGFNALVIYFTDDTKRKEAEDKLRKSEENFRNLIHNLKQGVILQDINGVMTICNQAALDMLGLTEEQLLGKTSFDPSWNVIHEDGRDFPGITYPVNVVLQTKKPVLDVVMGVYRPATNDRVWLLVNAEPVLSNDREIINVVCSFADLTVQKKLSKELIEQEVQKQKQLTQATIDGQEKERLQIGKELHDNINQHLTTTRLYLEVAREKATGEVLEMINLSHKTLADIINEIRHLSQSLVPPTLGDIGLVESVQDLCDSLKRVHKFNIDFYSRYFSEELLKENLKLMFFRIIQEQVNNIVRHAQAGSVQIKLQSDAEYITLNIIDDGIGFDPANYKKGLGISSITNRAGLFNGKVEIDAAPGKGCSLSVIIPIETTLESDELM